jgi:hypothetical protein
MTQLVDTKNKIKQTQPLHLHSRRLDLSFESSSNCQNNNKKRERDIIINHGVEYDPTISYKLDETRTEFTSSFYVTINGVWWETEMRTGKEIRTPRRITH